MKKRLLCFAVIITLILGGSCFPAGAAGFTDTAGTKYETAANMLSALGFVAGYDDGTFDINEPMTRAEFASILAKLALLYDMNSGGVYFYDVPSNHWAGNAINNVCAQGLMAGTDKYFRPDDALTLDEVSRGLVTLLGYAQAGQATSYASVAISLGIYKNASLGAKITRGDILIILYNALNVDLSVVTKFRPDGNTTSEVKRGNTILTRNFNIFKAKGQFTAAGNLDLIRTVNEKTGFARIDDALYALGAGVEVGRELLARNTEFYYFDAGDGETPVLLYYSLEKDDEVIEAEAGAISAEQSTTTQLVYYDERNREQTRKISTAARFIVNGRLISDLNKADALFDIVSGSVRVVIPKNGLNEVVWIDRYEYHLVSAAGTKSLFLKSGAELDLDGEKDGLEVAVYTASGGLTTINDVIANSAVALAEVTAADGITYRSVYVLKSVTGNASEIAPDKIVIGDKEYGRLESLDVSRINLSIAYTFFIGLDGRICLYDAKAEDTLTFAYLVKIYLERKGVTEKLAFRILNSNGEKQVYEAADTIRINDAQVRRSDFMKPTNNPIYTYLFTGGGTTEKRQVIAYKENARGEITHIYTAMPAGTPNAVLTLDADRASLACKTGAIFNFGGQLTVKDRGFIVAAPINPPTGPEDKGDDYEVWPATYFGNDTSYTVEGYNVNELLEAEVLVVLVNNTDAFNFNDNNTYTCIFDQKSEVLLEDGTQTYAVTYWQQGTRYTKTIADRSGKTTYESTIDEVKRLSRGDCFKIELTSDNAQIKNIGIEFFKGNRAPSPGNYNDGRLMFYGQIQAVGTNSVVIRSFFNDPGNDYLGTKTFLFKNAGRVSTYLYTSDERPIEYIPNCLAAARVGDWVMFQSRSAAARTMVIYRDESRLPNGRFVRPVR